MTKSKQPPLEFVYYMTQVGTEPLTTTASKIPDGDFVTIQFNTEDGYGNTIT